MLRIDSSNSIYLTKGDSGTINLTLQGDVGELDTLIFTVRNAQNLDAELIVLKSNESSTKGLITFDNNWKISLYAGATSDLKRKRYVYDIALFKSGEEDQTKVTFTGGDANKLGFIVT